MFMFQAVLVSLAAGLLTWALNHRLQRGPVLASAVTTLTAGLILPGILEQGAALVPVAACASYVSMSATVRLRGQMETGLALVLAALLYLASTKIFVGVGGKLGTIAAISVMTVWGGAQTLRLLARQLELPTLHRIIKQ